MRTHCPASRFCVALVAVVAGCLASPVVADDESDAKKVPESPLEFEVKDIEGEAVELEKYRGRAVVIVNVASRCGLTDRQYTGLEALYEKHVDDGLVVLAFPANDFGRQEPGTNLQISQFCEKRGVKFPLFAKISVKGEAKHPLYRFLTSKETNGEFAGEIQWNFQKFLIHPDGHVMARFSPSEDPLGEEMTGKVKKALAAVPDEVKEKIREEKEAKKKSETGETSKTTEA